MTGAVVYGEALWAHDCVGLRDPGLRGSSSAPGRCGSDVYASRDRRLTN